MKDVKKNEVSHIEDFKFPKISCMEYAGDVPKTCDIPYYAEKFHLEINNLIHSEFNTMERMIKYIVTDDTINLSVLELSSIYSSTPFNVIPIDWDAISTNISTLMISTIMSALSNDFLTHMNMQTIVPVIEATNGLPGCEICKGLIIRETRHIISRLTTNFRQKYRSRKIDIDFNLNEETGQIELGIRYDLSSNRIAEKLRKAWNDPLTFHYSPQF